MRYYINFDKTINQLVPHYLGGRKLILFLQAIMHPLRSVNDMFVNWAKETKIEASMTSQVFPFEWFLNRKFQKYFSNSEERISIANTGSLGVPIYHQSANVDENENMVIYHESEDLQGTSLYYSNELTDKNGVSFIVYTPKINESLITQEAYIAMLTYCIEKYRLANKTYTIKFYA